MRRLGHSCLCGYRAEIAQPDPPTRDNPRGIVTARSITSMATSDELEMERARRTAPGAKGRGHWTFRGSVGVPRGEAAKFFARQEEKRRIEEAGGLGGNEGAEREEELRHVGGVGVHDRPVGMNGVDWGMESGRENSRVVVHGGLGPGHVEEGGRGRAEMGAVTKVTGEVVPVVVAERGSAEGEVVAPVRPAEVARGTTQGGVVTGPEGGLVPVKVRHRSSEHEEITPMTRQPTGEVSRSRQDFAMGPALSLPVSEAGKPSQGDNTISAPPSPVPVGLHDGFPRRQST